MPFIILEMVILHQIPLSPKSVRINNKASGIRSAVKTMLFTDCLLYTSDAADD